jgi:hypothetical protein
MLVCKSRKHGNPRREIAKPSLQTGELVFRDGAGGQ